MRSVMLCAHSLRTCGEYRGSIKFSTNVGPTGPQSATCTSKHVQASENQVKVGTSSEKPTLPSMVVVTIRSTQCPF